MDASQGWFRVGSWEHGFELGSDVTVLNAFDLSQPPALRLDSLLRGRSPVAVLGMGNELLGDDAVGHRIAQDVENLAHPDWVGIPVGIALENAYGLVRRARPQLLLIVDAVAMEGMAPGAWDLWPPEGLDAAIHSTHSVPLPLFVRMWREDIPGLEVAFLGINLGQARQGAPLSAAVAEAREAIVALFRSRN